MPRQSAAQIISVVAVSIALAGVFWLPWHVGEGPPVPGESYALGFSNRVGILALAAAIAVMTGARLLDSGSRSPLSWFEDLPQAVPAPREARVEYGILATASVVWCSVLWWWGRYLVDPAWAEARGFHNGMDLLALGKVPYRDFFYNYGPATLYLPYGLSAATGGDLSFETAYLVAMVAFTAIGFWGLFLLVRTLALPTPQRAIALGLSLAAWAMINMGLQYTPLRFFVVPGSIVLLDAALNRRYGIKATWYPFAIPLISAATAAFACLVISPEMGIAGSLGVIAFGVPRWMAGKRGESIAIWLGCLAVNGAMLLFFPAYLLSVVAFASGGANFPIYPNLHNLVLVGISVCIFPRLIAAALRNPSDRRACLSIALAVGGGMMLPAALGRCDPGHVFINTTVPATIMFAAAWAHSRRTFIGWTVLHVVTFFVLLQLSYWSHYSGNYVVASQMRQFYDTNPAAVAEWGEKWLRLKQSRPQGPSLHWSSVLPFPEELDEVTRQGTVMLIAGDEWNYFLARYLHLQAKILPDYFHAYSQGAVTPSQMDRKIEESLAARFLLIPVGVLAPLQGKIDLAAYERSVQEFMSRLLLFPVRSPVRRAPYLPNTVIAKRLLEHFEPIGQYRDYVVLKKKE